MRNIKLTIEYDGGRYQGWQRLGHTDKTIQGKIEHILTQITGTETEIVGSGRTDAGTHARGQVANFKTESDMELDAMQEILINNLPQDIIVKKLEEVHDRFHSRYNATGKQYSYYVWNQAIPSAFERNYSFHYPEELDMKKMQAACDKLIGKHDFIGFSALKKSKKSTIRTLDSITIEKEGSMLHFTFKGKSFLHKMVRILTGTILEIGSGTLDLDSIDEVFESGVRSEAGLTVPAQGLFLDRVSYD
ncbi:tRNA pseudouridine(38-40) synthase TruA [Alkalibacterium psychrotolerans]